MVDGLVVGDPAEPDTYIGPVVTAVQHERVSSYIELGVKEGARIVVGGLGAPDDDTLIDGYYIRPTLFADVDNSMRIARRGNLRPSALVIAYEGVDEAVPHRQRLGVRPSVRIGLDRRP